MALQVIRSSRNYQMDRPATGSIEGAVGTTGSPYTNPETSKAYDEAMGGMRGLMDIIRTAYSNLMSAGRERDAYALADASEKFANTATGLGVNAFARAQAFSELQGRLNSVASMREAELSERQLAQLKDVQDKIGELGIAKASTLFAQGMQERTQAAAERAAAEENRRYSERWNIAMQDRQQAQAEQAKAQRAAGQAAVAQRIAGTQTGNISLAESMAQRNLEERRVKALADYLKSRQSMTAQIAPNASNAEEVARTLVLNQGLGARYMGTDPNVVAAIQAGARTAPEAVTPSEPKYGWQIRGEAPATQTTYGKTAQPAATTPSGRGWGTTSSGKSVSIVPARYNPMNYSTAKSVTASLTPTLDVAQSSAPAWRTNIITPVVKPAVTTKFTPSYVPLDPANYFSRGIK